MPNIRLVAGIDPGTTTAVACFDLLGNFIACFSGKEMGLDEAVRRAHEIGKVILIGTDKAHVPGFIDKFSARTGAKVVAPEEDLKLDEKRKLAEPYLTKNAHELDAIAAAVFALKRNQSLFQRVANHCEKTAVQKERLRETEERIIELVVKNEGMNITLATALILAPQKEEVKLIQQVVLQKTFAKEYDKLYAMLEAVQQENHWLRQQINSLRHERAMLKSQANHAQHKLQTIDLKGKAKRQVSQKETRIVSLSRHLEGKEQTVQELKEGQQRIIALMRDKDRYVMMRHLRNCSREELMRIDSNDAYLYVDNATEFSEQEAKRSLKSVKCIVAKRYPSKFLVPVIDASKVKCEYVDGYALVDKEMLLREEKKMNLIFDIVQDYKNERGI